MIDPLQTLERPDKHYLGSGSGAIFAPRFPSWLDWPGFWDEVDIYNYQIAPLFTVTLLRRVSNKLVPVAFRQRGRNWSPAELVAHYDLGEQLAAREHRSVLQGGWFLSEWVMENRGDEEVEIIAVVWSAQETEGLDLTSVHAETGSIGWSRRLEDRCGGDLVVEITLAATPEPVAAAAYLSERSALQPRWEFAPFAERARAARWIARTAGDERPERSPFRVRTGGAEPAGRPAVGEQPAGGGEP
jgi:hypothetical protein